jgi:hypothetical protein
MKNLTKILLITVCSFLLIFFCGYSLAETGSSPAAVKASKEATFPTRSVPGLYVNNPPVFSVSYPADWVERIPDKPGCVFKVTSTERLPGLEIYVFQALGIPLEYAASDYLMELVKTSRDVKLLYDKPTQRADGTPAREALFEGTVIASGNRWKGLFVTTRKGDEWNVTTVIVDSSKGEINESLKKIAHSLKFKP